MYNEVGFDKMIKTKFGNGRKRNDGYIQITTKPYAGKLLHRLVWEEHYGPIPEGYVVHHIDKDKSNCAIENLVLLSKNEHHSLHHWGSGRIDAAGGMQFLSAEKNKGKTMSCIAEDLGYTQAVPIHQYLKYRDTCWDQL